MLLRQTHNDRKSPIKVKRPRNPQKNPLVDKAKQTKKRLNNFLLSENFLPPHPTLLAIGNIKAKIIIKGVRETS